MSYQIVRYHKKDGNFMYEPGHFANRIDGFSYEWHYYVDIENVIEKHYMSFDPSFITFIFINESGKKRIIQTETEIFWEQDGYYQCKFKRRPHMKQRRRVRGKEIQVNELPAMKVDVNQGFSHFLFDFFFEDIFQKYGGAMKDVSHIIYFYLT